MFRRRSSIPGQDLVSSEEDDEVEISGPNACASVVVLVFSTWVTVEFELTSIMLSFSYDASFYLEKEMK